MQNFCQISDLLFLILRSPSDNVAARASTLITHKSLPLKEENQKGKTKTKKKPGTIF